MLDFNAIPPPTEKANPQYNHGTDAEDLRQALLDRLESGLIALFPAGKTRRSNQGDKFLIGDVLGSPGDSLEIVMTGDKAGLWTDRATGDGGDVFALIARANNLHIQTDFPRILDLAAQLLGHAHTLPTRKNKNIKKPKKGVAVDDLGPATSKWNYLDAAGHLIAVVYRYDPVGEDGKRRKEFRPWDAKRRKSTPPEPRPLYNQPRLLAADRVILTEGEKCAQALIDFGVVATTAMHGANAPVDKTDWSPLAGKSVLIWPDKDKPGWDYALRAAEALFAHGVSQCMVLLPPDDKPEGWDASDAVVEGFDVAAFLERGERYVMQPTLPATAHVLGAGEDHPDNTPTNNPVASVWATEDALALAFTGKFSQDWRYVAAWGRWLVWTGQRWQHEDTLKSQHLIRHICRDAALKMDNHKSAVKLASSGTVGGVERLARTDRRHAATATEWDADPWLLNTPGGVVNLKNGLARPHDRADRMTKMSTAKSPVSTSDGADASCPTWRAFLQSSTNGDIALQAYLARMVGYCLTGSTQEHAIFFVYGTGGNGKSVFINTVANLLGDYATHAPMDSFMETRSDRHPTDMAGLRGARLVCSIETEQGRRWAESKIKALTGGDPISARFMRQDFFEFTPQFKLVVAGNHKPSIRNVDEAMKRRLHLIPFTVTIPPEQRDQHLPEKLLSERDGILSWAIEGCLEWQRMGLQPPQCVLDATDEYFESEDAIGRWLGERCVRHANAKALTFELFNDWKQWAETNGEFIGSQKRFADALLTRRIDKWRNSMGARGFVGIGLKAPAETQQQPHSQHLPYKDN